MNHSVAHQIVQVSHCIARAFHEEHRVIEPLVCLLCSDGSLQVTLGLDAFLTRHLCEQAPSLDWRLRDLPLKLPTDFGINSAVAVSKRTGLHLRRILAPSLKAIGEIGWYKPYSDLAPCSISQNGAPRLSVSRPKPLSIPFDVERTAKCKLIRKGAIKGASTWPFDKEEIANEVLLILLPKLDSIFSPYLCGCAVAKRICSKRKRIEQRQKAQPLVEQTPSRSSQTLNELLSPIVQYDDQLTAWLLCAKCLTGLTIKQLTGLANFWTKSDHSEAYYRLMMHAAFKKLDL